MTPVYGIFSHLCKEFIYEAFGKKPGPGMEPSALPMGMATCLASPRRSAGRPPTPFEGANSAAGVFDTGAAPAGPSLSATTHLSDVDIWPALAHARPSPYEACPPLAGRLAAPRQ
jgi:hypothetical protein